MTMCVRPRQEDPLLLRYQLQGCVPSSPAAAGVAAALRVVVSVLHEGIDLAWVRVGLAFVERGTGGLPAQPAKDKMGMVGEPALHCGSILEVGDSWRPLCGGSILKASGSQPAQPARDSKRILMK